MSSFKKHGHLLHKATMLKVPIPLFQFHGTLLTWMALQTNGTHVNEIIFVYVTLAQLIVYPKNRPII